MELDITRPRFKICETNIHFSLKHIFFFSSQTYQAVVILSTIQIKASNGRWGKGGQTEQLENNSNQRQREGYTANVPKHANENTQKAKRHACLQTEITH